MTMSNQVLLGVNVFLTFLLVCGALCAAHMYVKCVRKHAELKDQWEKNLQYLSDRHHRKQIWKNQAAVGREVLELIQPRIEQVHFELLREVATALDNASMEE